MILEECKLPFAVRWFSRNKGVIGPFPEINFDEYIQSNKTDQIGQIPLVFCLLLDVFEEQYTDQRGPDLGIDGIFGSTYKAGDVLTTAVLAAIGAVVSYIVSRAMARLGKRPRERP